MPPHWLVGALALSNLNHSIGSQDTINPIVLINCNKKFSLEIVVIKLIEHEIPHTLLTHFGKNENAANQLTSHLYMKHDLHGNEAACAILKSRFILAHSLSK